MRPIVAASGVFVAAVLTLAACGGGSSGGSTSGGAGASPAANSAAPGNGGGAGFANRPGANGKIAALAGTTMQVQNPQTGQVAVTWTATTTFSHPVAVALSSVKAGNCIVATATSGNSSDSTFTATDITITAPVNGQCGAPNRTGGQGPGGFPSGGPTSFPSGAPRSFPSGATRGRFPGAGAFVTGTVTSVSGSSIVVDARQFGSATAPTSRTVNVATTTKISTQRSTTSQSLKVGLCVNANGKADSAGTVTATSVRISEPVGGQCTFGFVGGRNG
jgi:hypothetical protein